jgi:hypothetical protein
MPCTVKLNDYYSVTISSDRERSGGWESEGEIFITATCRDIGVSVSGEGRTLPASERRALAQARERCPVRPPDGGK